MRRCSPNLPGAMSMALPRNYPRAPESQKARNCMNMSESARTCSKVPEIAPAISGSTGTA
eukprot:7423649-Alexandrium_andersonii.AAC.1